MQLRKGPNYVGFLGIGQPIADAVKLLVKEIIIPIKSNQLFFILSPLIAFFLSLIYWSIIPFGFGLTISYLNYSLLFIFALGGLSVYPVLLSGWASNSKYSLFGSLRSTSAMISYELVIGLILLNIVVSSKSLNLNYIILAQEKMWFILPFWPAFLMYLIAALAETSRAPFDLNESESELVSGFQTEYSGFSFSLFALTEYSHIVVTSVMIVLLFMGGYLWPFTLLPVTFYWLFPLKSLTLMSWFIWTRAAVPRYRLDNLMYLNWKSLLLSSLAFLVWVILIFHLF